MDKLLRRAIRSRIDELKILRDPFAAFAAWRLRLAARDFWRGSFRYRRADCDDLWWGRPSCADHVQRLRDRIDRAVVHAGADWRAFAGIIADRPLHKRAHGSDSRTQQDVRE